jgi:EAL domain-containing protein (putative c-di-GMP-specific phosphodiesterase class I)
LKVWKPPFLRRIGRRRIDAVWTTAVFAAVWPYVAAPLFLRLGLPWPIGLSLGVTFIALALFHVHLKASAPDAPARAADATAVLGDKSKVLQRSWLPDMPDRAALEAEISSHGEGALGVIRFANQPAMAAFNAVAASRAMAIFAQRLRGAAGQRRVLAKLDDSTFALWFASRAADTSPAELASIGYVAAQDIVDADLTVTPEIYLGWMERREIGEDPAILVGRTVASLSPLKRFPPAAARTPAIRSAAGERFAMEQALRRAVREGQLFLNYQPLVAEAGGVVGAEVLLRWSHPTLGLVPPARFVPLLEETGLIHEIGRWTLNSACRQLREWRSQGEAGIRLAVNLSAVQLEDPELGGLITRMTASHGLSPADIELELTETAAMTDSTRTLRLFQDLRAQGFGLALDDFGSGHSNLGYLQELPFTKLKIDRAFVSNIDSRPGSRAICKALIELGAGLGISVLAEGVERSEEVAALHRLGCSIFQGYYFSRPLSADAFTERLGDANWLAFLSEQLRRERRSSHRRMTT